MKNRALIPLLLVLLLFSAAGSSYRRFVMKS